MPGHQQKRPDTSSKVKWVKFNVIIYLPAQSGCAGAPEIGNSVIDCLHMEYVPCLPIKAIRLHLLSFCTLYLRLLCHSFPFGVGFPGTKMFLYYTLGTIYTCYRTC